MYAKLFSRITESSLMEEAINVRYTFVMLLAIADAEGYVIGTDVAIARRLNMTVAEFGECVGQLMEPDPNSNSKEEDGRRIVQSDHERGYKCVNYRAYRDMKDEQDRREYMREYMRKRRSQQSKTPSVNGVNTPLAGLTHAEAGSEAEAEAVVPRASQTAEAPTLKEWLAECQRFGVPAKYGESKYWKFDSTGWEKVRRWRSKVREVKTWWTNDGCPRDADGPKAAPDGKLVYQAEVGL